MYQWIVKLFIKICGVEFGKNLILKGIPVIFNCRGGHIRIGDNVIIKSSFFSNLIGMYSRSILITRARDAIIEIGDNVGISATTIYARKKIIIGDNTVIGANCKILDNDFHPIDSETRNKLMRMKDCGNHHELIPSSDIMIGNNCFIGCNSIILKGTILEDNCVVGAGSVVKGTYTNGSVICGNPAKIIKVVK